MQVAPIIAGLASASLALLLIPIPGADAGSTAGFSLDLGQRNFRIFNNFSDQTANDNLAPHAEFAGFQGATVALWKAAAEWGSALHGTGAGDPSQPADLGSGAANFDFVFQGEATDIGTVDGNVMSEISGGSGGLLAFGQSAPGGDWRIRFYSNWIWQDGPGQPSASQRDLQGVATHQLGHVLGLLHSSKTAATMSATLQGTGYNQRSIEPNDINCLQQVYGAASLSKPLISGVQSAGPNSILISGQGFDSFGNQVWFTKASPSPSGEPVMVTSVASQTGQSLTVQIPPGSGPGDIHVRRNGTAHNALSNGWPFDPSSLTPTCGVSLYGLGLGGANTGSLSATTPVVGGLLTFSASAMPANAPGVLAFSSAQAVQPALGGTALIDFPGMFHTLPFVTLANGSGSIAASLPGDPAMAYLTAFSQAASIDSSGAWALTNGVKLVICP